MGTHQERFQFGEISQLVHFVNTAHLMMYIPSELIHCALDRASIFYFILFYFPLCRASLGSLVD